MIDLAGPAAAVASRRAELSGERALLAGISGIDGSGKGFVAARLRARLERLDLRVALLTASVYRPHLYDFHDVDVVLLEGIFIYKRAHRPHFDLAFWIDCTFDTALERALRRAQEGLPPAQTVEAYRTIYFPAQRLHEERDQPRARSDAIILNDPRLGSASAASG